MALDVSALIFGFLISFTISVFLLRLLGGETVPLFFFGYVSIPIASMVAIEGATPTTGFIKTLTIAGCLSFLLFSCTLRIYRPKKQDFKPAPSTFNPIVIYVINMVLCGIFIPIMLKSLLVSGDPHKERIAAIQGLGFLFYSHYSLSLGILTLYLTKVIKNEQRSLLLGIAALASSISLLSFGGRVFPLFLIIGLFFMINPMKYKSVIKAALFIFAGGLVYFVFVSSGDNAFADKIGFRLFNSSDILYYLNNPKAVRDLIRLYPYNFWDLMANPFWKAIHSARPFSSPGPFFFGGEGQGPLPFFIFDGFFYFGELGFMYLVVFPFLFWLAIARSIQMRNCRDDGERLLVFSLILIPVLHIYLDLASINGFIYILGISFVTSRLWPSPIPREQPIKQRTI